MAPSSTIAETPAAAVAPGPRRRWELWLVGTAVVVFAVAKFLQVFAASNFHTVIPGKIYRGAQPSSAAIDMLVKQYGIRTILNLRGT